MEANTAEVEVLDGVSWKDKDKLECAMFMNLFILMCILVYEKKAVKG